jgi:hypothetical protein
MSSGYTTSLPDDVLLNTGVLYKGTEANDGRTPIGVSRGGLTFNPNKEVRNIEFDGKRAKISGLDRVIDVNPVIEGTFIQLGTVQIPIFETGVTTAAGSGNVTTDHTPQNADLLYGPEDYINNLTLVFQRQAGGFVQVRFYQAVVSTYNWAGTDKSEAEIRATFEARLPEAMAASNSDQLPYIIEELSALS